MLDAMVVVFLMALTLASKEFLDSYLYMVGVLRGDVHYEFGNTNQANKCCFQLHAPFGRHSMTTFPLPPKHLSALTLTSGVASSRMSSLSAKFSSAVNTSLV